MATNFQFFTIYLYVMNKNIGLLVLGFMLLSTVVFSQNKKHKKQPAENQISMQNAVVSLPPHPEDVFFLDLFKKYPGVFDSVLANRKENNVQIIYTQINRDKQNKPILKHFYFNRHAARYHYPASTVKLPLALLALEKLNKLNLLGIDKYTTIVTDAEYSGQMPQYNEPNSPDGKPTIANYIKQILMVSDNNAANRLYEFLGQKYISDQLKQKGYSEAQIIHRLDRVLTEDENRHTNPVKFLDTTGRELYAQPMQYNKEPYDKKNDSIWKSLLLQRQLNK